MCVIYTFSGSSFHAALTTVFDFAKVREMGDAGIHVLGGKE